MADPMTGGPNNHGGMAPERNQGIELLRIFAAYGIVAYHGTPVGTEYSYAGLSVFLILSPMLNLGVNWARRRSFNSLVKSLLFPWIFWMIIYGALRLIVNKPLFATGNGIIADILYGFSPHLWFLPFIFFVIGSLEFLKRHIAAEFLFAVSLIGTLLLLVTASLWHPWLRDIGFPYAQWLNAAPLVGAGITLGLSRHVTNGKYFLIILASAFTYLSLIGIDGLSVAYAVGFFGVLFFDLIGRRAIIRFNVEPVSRCMMGVYLSHIIVLLAVRTIISDSGFLGVTAAFLLSLLFVWLSRRLFPLSRLVL